RVAGRVEEAPEASRIVEAHDHTGVELDVDVVMRETREVAWQDPQAPRHPEMHEQRAPFQCNQQVLGAAADIQDALPGHLRRQRIRYGPTQAPLVNLELDNALAGDMCRETTSSGFDFW